MKTNTNSESSKQITLSESIAKEFSQYIRWWLSGEELTKVIARNKTPKYKGLCATHDFCDGNDAMLLGFQKIMGRDPDVSAEGNEDMKLMEKAWDIAKENNFYAKKLIA